MPPHRPPEAGSSLQHAAAVAPDLVALRTLLLRYARARVRNVTLAEDAVSETLLVALQMRRSYPGRAQSRAWIYGILRHKLVDQLRLQGREIASSDCMPEPDSRGLDWFVGGAWCGVMGVMPEPDQALGQRQFMLLLLRCSDRLPPAQRQVFVQRELRGDDPADICRQLGITEGHLWVLMHRARTRLRALMSEQGLAVQRVRESPRPKRPVTPAVPDRT